MTGIGDVEGWESAEILEVINDLFQIVRATGGGIVPKLTGRRGNELELAADGFDVSVAKKFKSDGGLFGAGREEVSVVSWSPGGIESCVGDAAEVDEEFDEVFVSGTPAALDGKGWARNIKLCRRRVGLCREIETGECN